MMADRQQKRAPCRGETKGSALAKLGVTLVGAMRQIHFTTVLMGIVLCASPACHRGDRDDDASRGASQERAASSKISRFSLQFEGAESLDFERHGDEFTIATSAGKAWGTLKLAADRVKLEQDGKETAKAKAKEYGFKVYDGDRELFKVKRKGNGYEVRRADDTEMGRFDAQSGRFASDEVTLQSTATASVLERGGRKLVTVQGPLSSSAALMLTVTEATLPQRLVMAAIVEERIAP